MDHDGLTSGAIPPDSAGKLYRTIGPSRAVMRDGRRPKKPDVARVIPQYARNPRCEALHGGEQQAAMGGARNAEDGVGQAQCGDAALRVCVIDDDLELQAGRALGLVAEGLRPRRGRAAEWG